MLVTLLSLVKFRNKNCKTTELGLLLQVLPVRRVTYVETLGSHLKPNIIPSLRMDSSDFFLFQYSVHWQTGKNLACGEVSVN